MRAQTSPSHPAVVMRMAMPERPAKGRDLWYATNMYPEYHALSARRFAGRRDL